MPFKNISLTNRRGEGVKGALSTVLTFKADRSTDINQSHFTLTLISFVCHFVITILILN